MKNSFFVSHFDLYISSYSDRKCQNDLCTYCEQILTFGGLTQSHYAVQIDAGLWLVTVLNKAEGLEVKSGFSGKAVACHGCSLLHRTSSEEQFFK